MSVATVSIRWRESSQWHEMTIAPDWRPATRAERIEFNARRMIWTGSPLVDAHMRATRLTP
jgi:hypothetical protein